MIPSILDSTKKVLGVSPEYDAFDDDILTHINAAFSILTQLGVGPINGYRIEDNNPEWIEYDAPQAQRDLIQTYIFLKVKILFDPPATSFHTTAAETQIKEYEWRLNNMREVVRAVNLPPAIVPTFDDQEPAAPVDPTELPDLFPANDFQANAVSNEILVEWNATDNVQYFVVWYNPGGTGWGFDQVLADEDHYMYSIATNEGVEYEIYVESTATGLYDPASTEHVFVTGIA